MAESVRFELTVGCPITSFQDWLLKPLGQLSVLLNYSISLQKSQGDFLLTNHSPCAKIFWRSIEYALIRSDTQEAEGAPLLRE